MGNTMTSDVDEFGMIVTNLVGKGFERTLATNSIKLRFGTAVDPRGDHYIWIDPPWVLYGPDGPITHSGEYNEEGFKEWSQLFTPLNSNTLTAWKVLGDAGVVFYFATGHSLLVPSVGAQRPEDRWYTHWYAVARIAEHAG
jgi:hypothetical protein